MAPRHEVQLEVMGTIAHVVTIGDGGDELVEGAGAHLRELEARWSRFESSSEISRLNASAGVPLVVSAPTVALIELGVEGWRVTNGCFDPTVLGDVMRAGYIDHGSVPHRASIISSIRGPGSRSTTTSSAFRRRRARLASRCTHQGDLRGRRQGWTRARRGTGRTPLVVTADDMRHANRSWSNLATPNRSAHRSNCG
jgi:hypothetical protein